MQLPQLRAAVREGSGFQTLGGLWRKLLLAPGGSLKLVGALKEGAEDALAGVIPASNEPLSGHISGRSSPLRLP